MTALCHGMNQMKARELLRRYRQGERDFRGVDLSGESLRGMNLTGIDLSGANLSETDLRGTNFTRAQLVGTEFAYARTGTPRRWIVPIMLIALVPLVIVSALLGFVILVLLATLYFPETDPFDLGLSSIASIYFGVVTLITFQVTIFTFYRKGFLAMLGPLTVAVNAAIVLALIGGAIGVGNFDSAVAGNGMSAFLAGSFAGALTSFVSFSFIVTNVLVTLIFLASTNVFGRLIVVSNYIFLFIVLCFALVGMNIDYPQSLIKTFLTAFSLLLIILVFVIINFKVAHRTLRGDPRDRFLRDVAVSCLSFGGTSFNYANLEDAKFAHAILKGAHFQSITLERTCFHLSKQLHLSRAYSTILSNRIALDLLVSLKSIKDKSYVGLSLKGAYLENADLADIDLTEADISHATLADADLQRATLTKTQALGTNFTATNLTAACVEAWNIDNTTQLDGAICDHIYLLENQQERRPHTGDFAPGEFTKLFEEVLNTVDLIFRDGIDWRAFLQTLKDVQVQHEDAALEIQSIENKGDGVIVVRLNADPAADKEQIHFAFTQGYTKALAEAEQKYKAELQAAKINHQEEIIALYRERNADVKEIASLMAQKPITVEATAISESKEMQGNDNSQNINVGGDFNADNSIVNFGTISGQVTNQINQLGAEQSELQGLLQQLQTAIESDTDLSDTDKTDALEQVKKLAEAGKAPEENQSRAKRAIGVIKDITAGLTETNKLVEACKVLLPAIGALFLL